MKTALEQIFEKDQKQHQTALLAVIPITRDKIEAIIIGALEGGSNGWYWLETIPANLPDGDFLSERVVEALISIPNFSLTLQDIETKETVGSLTLDSLQKAIVKTAYYYPHYFKDLMADDLDAGGSDLIFQLAVMGRETFC